MTAYLWAVVTALIWGVVPLIEKLGLRGTDPTIGVFARSVGVILGIAILAVAWSPWTALIRMSIGSFLLLALGGFMASVLGQLAFYRALKLGTVSQMTPIAGAYPFVAALLGWVLLHEPLSPPRVLGVILIVLGVVLLRH